MYRCDNPKCRAEFEEPATRKEYHNEIEGDFYELFPCCPYCGCDDYLEIEDEDEEIEDGEIDIESFDFVVQVRYIAYHTHTMKNAYYYAATKEEADAIVDKYMTKAQTTICRIYKLMSEARNE